MYNSEDFKKWFNLWQERLKKQTQTEEEIYKLMKNSNPAVIPRNHNVEKALKEAEEGDFTYMTKLIEAISKPYKHSKEQEAFAKLPKKPMCSYKTYCGT